jgi:hypothetical protein
VYGRKVGKAWINILDKWTKIIDIPRKCCSLAEVGDCGDYFHALLL